MSNIKYLTVPKGLRKLFINFSFRSAANLLAKLLGLVTLPIITRAMGPDGYGQFSLVNLVVQYTGLPVALLGLSPFGIREIAKQVDGERVVDDVISSALSMAVPSIFVSACVILFLFHLQPILVFSIFIAYSSMIAASVSLEFYYVGNKDLMFPTMCMLIGQIFFLLGVIFFVKSPKDLIYLVLFSSITPIVGSFLQLVRYLRDRHKIHFRLSLYRTLALFKRTYKLGISSNMEAFYGSIPRILLVALSGTYYLGIYSAGYKVFSILVTFYVTFFYALAPYLVDLKRFEETRKAKYFLVLFVLVLGGGFAIGLILYFFGDPLVILLLGKSFGESTGVFKAISLTLIPLWPTLMLFGNVLIFWGNEKYYLYGMIISTGLVLILSPFFIDKFQALGAVYSMALSMLVATVYLGISVHRVEPGIYDYVKNYGYAWLRG